MGGDFNCITKPQDCTKYPEAKMSPCLRRLVNNFNMSDTFRSLYPMEAVYSRYYGRAGQEGATRIDRSYTWGEVTVVEAKYEAVAFSDHMAYIVEIEVPEKVEKMLSPKHRPVFKTSPEVVNDTVFRRRLQESMAGWQEVRERGLAAMSWWEIMVNLGLED